MGKLKISKAKSKKNTKGSSGIPNWLLSTLVILVVVAVIATCVGTFIASSGLTMRLSTAMSIDNYKVNGNMMAYFYQTTYMNFMNNYSSYLSYLSFNQELDPRDQQFNPEGSYDSAVLGEFEGTWFDYFMVQTKDSVKNLLIYCAEADKLGITLDETEQAEVDASLETLLINIRSQYGAGLSDSTYLANIYGKGVNKSDIRDAMELSALASKAAQKISDDIEAGITDERIQSTYDNNKLDYDLVDYFNYTFNVHYDDIVAEKYGDDKDVAALNDEEKATVLELYKAKIAEVHAAAKALSEKTTLEDFKNFVIDYAVKDAYDKKYKSNTESLTSEQLPTTEELATIKTKTIEAVIKEVTEGKETVTDDVVTTEGETKTYTLYDIAIKAEFAEAVKTLKSNLFDAATSAKNNGLYEKANYIAPDSDGHKDDFSEWAFSTDRKVNDTTNIETGDGANEAEVTVSSEKFTATVSILTKTVYRDETLSRNLAYMLFTDETAAKTAIQALEATEGLDKDKFLNVANDSNNPADASTYYEDCVIGTMQSDKFDEWLFAAKTGEFTKTPITMSDGSYMVALYVSEGTTYAWKYTVKSNLYSEDYTAYEERMNGDFASLVVINDTVINKIGA